MQKWVIFTSVIVKSFHYFCPSWKSTTPNISTLFLQYERLWGKNGSNGTNTANKRQYNQSKTKTKQSKETKNK
jgi:hypothetical protein